MLRLVPAGLARASWASWPQGAPPFSQRGLTDAWIRFHTIPKRALFSSTNSAASAAGGPPRAPCGPLGGAPKRPHAAAHRRPPPASLVQKQRALHLAAQPAHSTAAAAAAATAAAAAKVARMATAAAAATTTTAAAASSQSCVLRLRDVFRWGGLPAACSLTSSSSSSSRGLLLPSWGVRTLQDALGALPLGRAAAAIREAVEECSLLLWKGNKWKGTWVPNKWKWYHRHGYWATRKKLLKFDTYRRYRYHEVKGLGQPKAKWWAPNTQKSPLSQATKFW